MATARAKIATNWFVNPKYLQSMLNPFGFDLAKKRIAIAGINKTAARPALFAPDLWSMFNSSEIISLRDLKAVSPEVIGSAITPRTASNPPMSPIKYFEISPTIRVPAVSSGALPVEKITMAPAAQTIAIKPSAIIVE